MSNAIIRIAGTFGSGKTTAARSFMTLYPTIPHKLGLEALKVIAYECDLSSVGIKTPVFLIGSYENVCGGTDGISSQEEVANRVMHYHRRGHVIYEGALVSSAGENGIVTKTVHTTGCDVYAFLDTPKLVCVERVKQRRRNAGNDKPFDHTNLVSKYSSVVRVYKNLTELGYDTRVLNHKDPHPKLLEIIKEYENK